MQCKHFFFISDDWKSKKGCIVNQYNVYEDKKINALTFFYNDGQNTLDFACLMSEKSCPSQHNIKGTAKSWI